MNTRYARWMTVMSIVALVGCDQRITFDPPQDHGQFESLEFVHLLARQPMVTYDQACRAMLLVADGTESPSPFEARVAELESRGVVSSRWDLAAHDAVDRGTLAYMIYKTCQVPPGLNTWLSSLSGLGDRRYTLKRVVREGIMPYGLPYQIPTGGEVVAALAKADEYMAKRGLYESGDVEVSSPADLGRSGAGNP